MRPTAAIGERLATGRSPRTGHANRRRASNDSPVRFRPLCRPRLAIPVEGTFETSVDAALTYLSTETSATLSLVQGRASLPALLLSEGPRDAIAIVWHKTSSVICRPSAPLTYAIMVASAKAVRPCISVIVLQVASAQISDPDGQPRAAQAATRITAARHRLLILGLVPISLAPISAIAATQGRCLGQRRPPYAAIADILGLATDIKATGPPSPTAIAITWPTLIAAAYAQQTSLSALTRLYTPGPISVGSEVIRQTPLLRRGVRHQASPPRLTISIPSALTALLALDTETCGLPAAIRRLYITQTAALIAFIHYSY